MTARLETVSVVVPTHHRPDALSLTLSRLQSVDYPPESYEVIVVDDGADQETERVSEGWEGAAPLRYVSQPEEGAASARNHGARIAEGALLIFCDDDVVVESDHVSRHLEARAHHGDALVNGVSSLPPSILAAFHATAFGRFRLALERQYEAEADGSELGGGRFKADFLSARNLAVSREMFWNLEGFDERFPYAGAEDQDLSLRAARAGCLLLRDHGIRVLHNEQIISLQQFCRREEHSAQTAAVLARKSPDDAGHRPIIIENRPLTRSDSPSLAAKKLVKLILSRSGALEAVHRLVGAAERAGLRERGLHRLYSLTVGLHIFRGIRAGLSSGGHP